MPTQAEFKFESKQWESFLNKLQTKLKDVKNNKTFGALIAIAAYKDIIKHFDDQAGPEGKWQPRSPFYKKYAESKGHNKILQFSGKLRQSLVPASSPRFRQNSSGIIIFTNVEYAAKHDQGLDGMPQRRFMWISKNGMDNLVKQTLKWLSE